MKDSKKTVLFVCTYNSARSPMAEGILKAEKKDSYDVFSAGIYPAETDRRAIFVMKEAGYDISSKKPASLGQYSGKHFDYVIFLCENAYNNAYKIPESENIILHKTEMPSGERDPLKGFAALRDELREWILEFFSDEYYLK
ncbi:MAG: arsenate reductase ArsC [Methanomicrobiaceae archaeon]|nr:arsenate reductase ArsC [Methanomicrobiaceae archaeon]